MAKLEIGRSPCIECEEFSKVERYRKSLRHSGGKQDTLMEQCRKLTKNCKLQKIYEDFSKFN